MCRPGTLQRPLRLGPPPSGGLRTIPRDGPRPVELPAGPAMAGRDADSPSLIPGRIGTGAVQRPRVRCLLPACDRPLSSPPESLLASDTPYSRLWASFTDSLHDTSLEGGTPYGP